jgi:hypothetical protein
MSALRSSNAWADALKNVFWDRSAWRKSVKGNWWVWVGGRPVTLFPRRKVGGGLGWAWAIGRSARERPLYSQRTYDDSKAAHAAAWEALMAGLKESA